MSRLTSKLWLLIAFALMSANAVHASAAVVTHKHDASLQVADMHHDASHVDEDAGSPVDESDDDGSPKLFHTHFSSHAGDIGALTAGQLIASFSPDQAQFFIPRADRLASFGVPPLIRPPRTR